VLIYTLPFRWTDLLAGEPARRQREEQRSVADRADCSAVSEGRCGLRRPVIGFYVTLGSGAIKPMPEAKIAQAVQLLDLMLEFFADDGHWTRGNYDDGNGGHCLVGALLHLSRKHRLPRAPAIALLQDAMPRPGLPLVHFNDACCGSVAELRSIILKARRLADDHAEQERAAAAVKAWLLARIEKRRAAPSADIADTALNERFAPERLAA
jgi:hypothetical protein